MSFERFQAVILDLDGVITQTTQLHAKAWKRMFDDYLRQRSEKKGESYAPFDIVEDYKKYVDGKPRYDGVRSFLQSREIQLPEGSPEEEAGTETVCGLGNRKNDLFHELMQNEGVEVYGDAVEQIKRWKEEGLKIAVVSSSKNCVPILEAAKLHDLFDAKVDGIDSEKLGLKGKPAPDIFLEGARQLQVPIEEAVVVEDSEAGIQAGLQGKFGIVVGVARGEGACRLQERGSHMVVGDLREIQLSQNSSQGDSRGVSITPVSALAQQQAFANRLKQHQLALFLDYDGTLTPIVKRPELAQLSEDMRSLLNGLSQRCTVAIISGRDRTDVRDKVKLDQLIYAGSHGFDITGPNGLHQQQEQAQASLPELDQAEEELKQELSSLEGAFVERKRFAIAIHHRQVASQDVGKVQEIVQKVQQKHDRLRQRGGKKIFELQPDVDWDKGKAVLWLLKTLDLYRSGVLAIYLGDDVTDEDAFGVLKEWGIGILVGDIAEHSTQAKYFLRNPEEVEQFLRTLLSLLKKDPRNHG